MAKKTSFDNLMTKLNYIFKIDMYIINNLYAIAGDKSFDESAGSYQIYFTPETIETLNEVFDKNKIYYISNIRKGKKDLANFVKEITNKRDIDDLMESFNNIDNEIKERETWDTFKESQEMVDELYEHKSSINLHDYQKNIPDLIISKEAFPTITEKNIYELKYTLDDTRDTRPYGTIIFNIDNSMYQLYLVYYFLDIDLEE